MLPDSKFKVTTQNKDRWTALHPMSQNGHVEIVKVLLDAKANVVKEINRGVTALHLMSQDSYMEVVKVLLDAKLRSLWY